MMSAAKENFGNHSDLSQNNYITPQLEEQFCNFIRLNMGIVIQDHQLADLRSTIQSACKEFSLPTPLSYYENLDQADKGSREFEYLVCGVTIGESYFFRDEEQIKFLKNDYLPELIRHKRKQGERSIRIWSAGCSQGQEVVTLAILLTELIPDIHDWNIHLLGTDINLESLSKAIKSRYTEWSFRAMSNDMRSRYFSKGGKYYNLKPEIKQFTRFAYLNLIEDSFPSFMTQTQSLDLIVCRNVFIYFNTETATPVMEKFSQCLTSNGCLLLGASDLLVKSVPELKMNSVGSTYYYEKVSDFPALAIEQTIAQKIKAVFHKPEIESRAVKKQNQGFVKSDKVNQQTTTKDSFNADVDRCIKLIKSSLWQEAISEIELQLQLRQHSDNATLLQLHAKALANMGLLDEAVVSCEESIAIDQLDKHSYLIYGVILVELDRLDEAEKALSSAIFLDNKFLEAHFQLGLLLVRSAQLNKGIKYLKNALQLAEKEEPEREVHESGGLTFSRLVDILKNDIKLYKDMVEEVHHEE